MNFLCSLPPITSIAPGHSLAGLSLADRSASARMASTTLPATRTRRARCAFSEFIGPYKHINRSDHYISLLAPRLSDPFQDSET